MTQEQVVRQVERQVCVLPGVGAGDSLSVDVVTERLSPVVDTCPHIDLHKQKELELVLTQGGQHQKLIGTGLRPCRCP